MPTYRVTSPDGRTFRVTAPEGATQDEVMAYVQAQNPVSVPDAAPDPTEGMSGFDKFAAGAGKAISDTGLGLRQLGSYIGIGDREAIQREIDERKRLDASLMNTGAGVFGNVVGNVSMALLPGGAAKSVAALPQAARAAPALNAAANALLTPKTIPGALALGGAQGAIQPVATDESRLFNTALGGLGGALVPTTVAAGKVAKQAFVDPFTARGQEKLVGRTLERFATDPASILNPRNAGALVPGSMPTLAEATGDIGLAHLQRAASNNADANVPLVQRALSNQDARASALRQIAGNPADRAAWVEARDDVAKVNYGAAFDQTPMLTPWVKGQITQLQKRPSFRKAWPQAMELAQEEGIKLNPKNTVQVAHYTKMALDDMIESAEGNAQRALIGTRDKLVTLMESKDFAPAYREARLTYADMSKPINQMDVGQALLNKYQSALADFGATAREHSARYADAMRNADVTAQKATKFRGAKLENILGTQQAETARNVARDLARRAQAQDLPSIGGGRQSLTASNLASQQVLRGLLGPMGLPQGWAETAIGQTLTRPVAWAYQIPEKRIMQTLGEAMADPDKAKDALLLARKNPAFAEMLDKLLPFTAGIGSGGLLSLSP